MRHARLLILFSPRCSRRAACSVRRPPSAAVVVQPAADLDSLAYGGGPRYRARPARSSRRWPRPAPRSGYTLDSGDKLRVVVFGQDGLTNTYASMRPATSPCR